MALIEVEHLTKIYKTYKRDSGFKSAVKSFFKRDTVMIHAVDDVSFQINEGEICGILGPNGAGKSTTIKMLCGALYPTSGKIDVMGFTPSKDRKKYVYQIGAVFGQKSQLIWDIPPEDSFRMNKAIYNISDKDYKERLDTLAGLLDVYQIMHKPTRVLSLGERMKCEFIMAMLHGPKIVFLDEPTIGLDVIAKAKIREFIKQLNHTGTTFILTTHDLEDVEQLAHRAIIINHGKKVFDQSLSKLKTALGEKKNVVLSLSKPFDGEIPGTKRLPSSSEMELALEVDLSRTQMDQFVSQISKTVSFKDISIKELPMEQIITKLYE